MRHWLMYTGSIWPEDELHLAGWNDETLRAPHACRVREGVVVTNNRVGSHIVHGKTIKELIEDGQLVDYDSNVHRVSNTTKRDELIDDIEALCLSIEKRQSELSRLVKELKC